MNPYTNRILSACASLRFTVVLLFLGMVLVLAGTLAQVDAGIWTVLNSYFRCFIAWIGPFPFPGGYTIGGLMLANLFAALWTQFKPRQQRLGSIILHAGLVLLLIGEVFTALFAVEGNMTIDEGSWSNFTEDARAVELAIVDASDPGIDRVVAVPGELLSEPGAVLDDPQLPFEISVVDWFPNSRLLRVGPDDAPARATRGSGQTLEAQPQREATGVGQQSPDAPSGYISLSRGGEKLGTWLISLYLDKPQEVRIGEQSWSIALRRARSYKPYTLHLIDFSHDKFTGTEMARNFSSLVRVVDPSQNEDRETLIYMNHPLRYGGDTFYQASYKRDESGTILQVVRNPGWLVPYISCTLVSLGLLMHFSGMLRRFARRARQKADSQPAVPQTRFQRLLPWVALLLLLVSLAGKARPPRNTSAIDLQTFGRIPVSSDGRVKPLDTVARNSLMIISDRQTFEAYGERQPAIRWLAELFAVPEQARQQEVFRIDQPDVLALIGKRQEDGKRFSLDTVLEHSQKVTEQARLASEVTGAERNTFQRHVLDLYNQLGLYFQLTQLEKPYVVPPLATAEDWQPLLVVLSEDQNRETENAAALKFRDIVTAYRDGDTPAFNTEVAGYAQMLEEQLPTEMNKARFEVFFNNFQPFYLATIFYLLAFLIGCVSYLLRSTAQTGWAASLLRTTNWLLLGTFALHTLGLAARVYLQGRPPVTNLYSTAVFVGWGCVLLAFFLERYHRTGLAAGMASLIGFVTLIIAHNLSTDGDTMQMMQAVLDSNFWLTTHVITITIGYSGTFLAGILGMVYIVLGVFTKTQNAESARSFTRMIFGVICFAVFFSFVGTVLGGIWADQSWGRFWGWDPKENGALLIVMWTALTLHARSVGMVRDRGFAALAVGGNIVTAWSWFGTNMLGVGLHSYGFMSSAAFWMALFFASQLLVMALALLPRNSWRSFAT